MTTTLTTTTTTAPVRFPQKHDAYESHLLAFHNWRGERPIDLGTVADYFADLNTSRYSASTILVKRAAVKSRYRSLLADVDAVTRERVEAELHALDRSGETRAPKVASGAIPASKVITEPEYLTLLSKCRSKRMRLIMETLWLTGCRISEVLGLAPADVKVDGILADLRVVGKGNKERHVRIPASLLERITETFRGTSYLFETSAGTQYQAAYVSGVVRQVAKRTLGRQLGAHSFRHSWATRMIGKTHKIEAVSTYLGHASVSTTMRFYVHEQLEATELFTDRELGLAKAAV